MLTIECDWCGDDIERYESQLNDTNFCDRNCYSKYRSVYLQGEENPNYSGATISYECEVCGDEKEIPRAWDRNPRFCSRECKASSERVERADVSYRMNENGYMVIQSGNTYVRLHRLVAVADYGFNFVAERDVHHRIDVPWLNFGDNLVPVTSEQHRREHGSQGNQHTEA